MADDRYNVKRQDVLQLPKFKNRHSVIKSKVLQWDNLLATKFALQNQSDKVNETLVAIERDKQQLMTTIYNKSLERARKIDQKLSNVAKFIVQHPEDTITHLQETLGNPGTHQPRVHDIHQIILSHQLVHLAIHPKFRIH